MAGKPDKFENWSRLEPRKGAARLWEMHRTFERSTGWRHRMARRGALAFSGLGLGELFEAFPIESPFGPGQVAPAKGKRPKHGGWGSKANEQHARAAAETVIEKLFGLDEPKTQMVATDAEWEVKRQGVWADRFIEGNFHQKQGSYLDFWDMARQGALISWVSTGMVAIRTEPDYVVKRVRSQLRSTLNTFIDPADRCNGQPLSYFDVTWENPEYMAEDERLTPKQRDMIWKGAKVPPHMMTGDYDGAVFGTPMVRVITAWRLPFGSFKGRYAVCVEGNDEPLFWLDWDNPEPALSFYRCNRSIGDDFWGENFIEIALDPLRDAEAIDDLAKDTMSKTSQTNLYLDGASTAPASVLNAKNVNVFRFDSKRNEKPPIVEKPQILNADYFQWRDRKIDVAHQLLGVPMLHQASQVQGASGSRSGRSIRLEASLLPERFARKIRDWRNWVAVDNAKNLVRAAREIGKVDPDWQVTWPGADFDAKVKVDVLDVDMTQYTMRPYAVSEQKNTPADRADAAQEMFERGEITAEQLQSINEGLLDTKRETRKDTAQKRYVSKVIDEILHGPEELIVDKAAYLSEHYIPPMLWLDPDAMLAQAAPQFLDAVVDGLPQNRRTLLRHFLADIWALRQQRQREDAMTEASVSVSATPGEAFPAPAGALPPIGGPLDPNALPPPGAPALGAPAGAPAGAPLPMPNAPGPAGMV